MNTFPTTNFVNPVDFAIPVTSDKADAIAQPLPQIAEHTISVDDLVALQECEYLLERLDEVDWLPVGVTGMKGNYTQGDRIGSWRASTYNRDFADILWQRLSPLVCTQRFLDVSSPTDHDHHRTWKAVEVNPLLRFVRYTDGGVLIPHYDAPFIESHSRRTLVSIVIYLDKDPNIVGGATRFLHDPQVDVPVHERNLQDWDHFASEKDVKLPITPQPGSALVFDHRILHDSEPVTGNGRKTILRTDIMFERVEDGSVFQG